MLAGCHQGHFSIFPISGSITEMRGWVSVSTNYNNQSIKPYLDRQNSRCVTT